MSISAPAPLDNLREQANPNFGDRELASAFFAADSRADILRGWDTRALEFLHFRINHCGSTTADPLPRFNHSGSTTPVAKAPPLLDRGGELSPAAPLLNQEGLSASEGGGFSKRQGGFKRANRRASQCTNSNSASRKHYPALR